MPKRIPVRPAKLIGNLFVLFVFIVIGVIYYTYVFQLFGPRAATHMWARVLLVFFHIFLFMLLWAFLQSMTTDPG